MKIRSFVLFAVLFVTSAAVAMPFVGLPYHLAKEVWVETNAAAQVSEKLLEGPGDVEVAEEVYTHCANAIDLLDPDAWVLQCNGAATEGKRCGTHDGRMSVCEGGECKKIGCSTNMDCRLFARSSRMLDTCRTYTCLNNECVDQYGIDESPNSAENPGAQCSSSIAMEGICGLDGDCEVHTCAADSDCPGFALECAVVRCHAEKGICLPEPVPDGTPCTLGTCNYGYCG